MKREVALQAVANRLRYFSLELPLRAGSGHPSSCLSMAEIMSVLFFDQMRINVNNPNDPSNDEFVLSKGHASPILWASFAEARIIPFQDLEGYRQFSSVLEGHPSPRMPWIKYATGSLGQGLSIACGMGLGQKLNKVNAKTYCLLGDGECAEGSVWEAAEFAAKQEINNLVAIIDANILAQSGESLHGKHAEVWKKKFEAFGWDALLVDGHSIPQLIKAFSIAEKSKKPFVIVAKTVKGKGVKAVEGKPGWHGKPIPKEYWKDLKLPKIDSNKLMKKARATKITKAKKYVIKQEHYDEGLATRKAFGIALANLGANPEIVVIDGDTKNSTYTDEFFKKYPERSFESYIAEQNMIGIAQGLSVKGFIPFAATFGAFLTRAHDQLRMASIARANLNIVGSHAGISIGEDGPSQMALDDITMFRSIPDSKILYPSDAISADKLTQLMIKNKGINYLRTSRPKTELIYKNNASFRIGGSKVLRKGPKYLVIAAGITVHEAIKAWEKKKFTLIDAYSIKPLDKNTIIKYSKGKKIIVVEDHYPEGGLADAIRAEGIKVHKHLCVKGIARSGSKEALMKHFKIDHEAILKEIK